MCDNKRSTPETPSFEHKRAERRKMLGHLDIKHDLLISALDSFNGGGDHVVTKKTLQSFPIMEWVDLNPKVSIRRRQNLHGDVLVFDTVMQPKGEFGMHLHPDCTETCDVISGCLADLMTNDEYTEGQSVFYEAGVKHIPVSITNTTLRVYFK